MNNTQQYVLSDIWESGFLHSKIYEFKIDTIEKKFVINFNYIDLRKGGSLIDCNLEFTDWLDFKLYLPDKKIYLDGDKVNEFYQMQKSYFKIYKLTHDDHQVIFKGHGNKDFFSLTILKPKIKITGDYDPD